MVTNAALTFIHDRARILGVEIAGDFVRLRAECSNGMRIELVPGSIEESRDLRELGGVLEGRFIVFSGYLRLLESGNFHVTALSIGIEPAVARPGH